MKQIAQEALIEAALKGVVQAFGGPGGRLAKNPQPHEPQCALQVINKALERPRDWRGMWLQRAGLQEPMANGCPECGALAGNTAWRIVGHLNDTHRFDLLTIATKMPVD